MFMDPIDESIKMAMANDGQFLNTQVLSCLPTQILVGINTGTRVLAAGGLYHQALSATKRNARCS